MTTPAPSSSRVLQTHASTGVRTPSEKLRAFSKLNPRMAGHFAQTMLGGQRDPDVVAAFEAYCREQGMEFSYDTVAKNIPFSTPLLRAFAAEHPAETLRYMEIGAFEGRTLVFLDWLMPGRIDATVVDAWFDPVANPDPKYHAIEARFHANMARTRFKKSEVRRGFSGDVLPGMRKAGEHFDLIYVDGSHTALDVMIDLCYCAQLLKVGGMLILDDYWHDISDISGPGVKQAVDSFFNMFHAYFDIKAVYRQVVAVKSAELPH